MRHRDYSEWLASRSKVAQSESITGAELNPQMFPHQRQLVQWALARGRAAIFADTGLGKTLMQTEWARIVSERGRVLILAPLAVAEQTVREAARFGIESAYRREDRGDRITVANYEMLDRFDPSAFVGVVLDESSILKSFDGSTRTAIIEAFRDTRFRLACTATPAPNDYTELGNHSEFLGVQSRVEMLSEYFVHDGGSTQDWRLKGHARAAFWRWVCSWAAVVRKPSDLGYSDEGFALPPLIQEELAVPVDHADAWTQGSLYAVDARTLSDQRALRRATMAKRVELIATKIASEPNEPAIVWCELNEESSALRSAIHGAVEVKGADSVESKRDALLGFADGKFRVLVSKPSICGHGMNWQHCARIYFIGASHSYEQTYQAIRRCYRFGQTRQVIVRTCVAETEHDVIENVARKHREAEEMGRQMVEQISSASYASGQGARREWNNYKPGRQMEVATWLK